LSSSQQLSPRRETGRGLFASDFFELGYLNRTAAVFGTQHLPCQRLVARRVCKRAAVRTFAMSFSDNERIQMTAYLISLALAGLLVIALWEVMP